MTFNGISYGQALSLVLVFGGGGGGSGEVTSVNGKTGVVVLKATDIKDNNGQTIQKRLLDAGDTLPTGEFEGQFFVLLVDSGDNKKGLYRFNGTNWILIANIADEIKTFMFKGFVSTTAPIEASKGDLWYASSTMPSTFPITVKRYNGSAWSSETENYTPNALDLWSNLNDNNGYYWFGNVWNKTDFDTKNDFLSLERLGNYLYKVTFDTIPDYVDGNSTPVGGCSAFVRDGKLYRNFDWKYDNTATFWVKCKTFEGIGSIVGLNDSNLDTAKVGQLPYHLVDGVNNDGIMISTHILYNDFNNYSGSGAKDQRIMGLPYYILSNVTSMATLETTIADYLANLGIPAELAAMEYLVQFIVTDGDTTKVITPKTDGSGYEVVTATANPKLTNFKWVAEKTVSRADLQTRPTGVERWNDIDNLTNGLEQLKFTLAYQNPTRLSEFIGIDGTTKSSTDAELTEIYNEAHAEYLIRTRDGATWQSVHSVVYNAKGVESLCVQEDFAKDYIVKGGGGAEPENYLKSITKTNNEITIEDNNDNETKFVGGIKRGTAFPATAETGELFELTENIAPTSAGGEDGKIKGVYEFDGDYWQPKYTRIVQGYYNPSDGIFYTTSSTASPSLQIQMNTLYVNLASNANTVGHLFIYTNTDYPTRLDNEVIKSEKVEISDPTTESFSGTADTQAELNAELVEEIKFIESKSDVSDIVQCYNRGTDTTKTDIAHYDLTTLFTGDIVKVLIDETHDDKISYYKVIESGTPAVKSFSYIGSDKPVETDGTSIGKNSSGKLEVIPIKRAMWDEAYQKRAYNITGTNYATREALLSTSPVGTSFHLARFTTVSENPDGVSSSRLWNIVVYKEDTASCQLFAYEPGTDKVYKCCRKSSGWERWALDDDTSKTVIIYGSATSGQLSEADYALLAIDNCQNKILYQSKLYDYREEDSSTYIYKTMYILDGEIYVDEIQVAKNTTQRSWHYYSRKISKTQYITLTSMEPGTLTAEQKALLFADNDNYIMMGGFRFNFSGSGEGMRKYATAASEPGEGEEKATAGEIGFIIDEDTGEYQYYRHMITVDGYKEALTGEVYENNEYFPTGGDVYNAVKDKADNRWAVEHVTREGIWGLFSSKTAGNYKVGGVIWDTASESPDGNTSAYFTVICIVGGSSTGCTLIASRTSTGITYVSYRTGDNTWTDWQVIGGVAVGGQGKASTKSSGSCNDVTNTGFYHVKSSVTDTPVSSTNFYVIVTRSDNDALSYCSQLAINMTPTSNALDEMYMRTMTAGSWRPWQRMLQYHDGSKSGGIKNANNMATPGFYSVINGGTNFPATQVGGQIITFYTNSYFQTQICFASTQDKMWVRRHSTGGWTPWMELVNKYGLTSVSDLKSYPILPADNQVAQVNGIDYIYRSNFNDDSTLGKWRPVHYVKAYHQSANDFLKLAKEFRVGDVLTGSSELRCGTASLFNFHMTCITDLTTNDYVLLVGSGIVTDTAISGKIGVAYSLRFKVDSQSSPTSVTEVRTTFVVGETEYQKYGTPAAISNDFNALYNTHGMVSK